MLRGCERPGRQLRLWCPEQSDDALQALPNLVHFPSSSPKTGRTYTRLRHV
jgi:hypothetical protein